MSQIKKKIFPLSDLIALRQSWKANDQTVVMTNGCFDIIHPGHVLYLETAKNQGDKLIVALNTDRSVKRLKGSGRPVQSEDARSIVISALESVDAVVLFDGDTPIDVVEALSPDVLVKGGDWSVDQIVGGTFVIENGGQVRSLPFEEGHSTTSIVEKILKNEGK